MVSRANEHITQNMKKAEKACCTLGILEFTFSSDILLILAHTFKHEKTLTA